MTYRGTCKADWIALGLSQQCERKKHFCLANHKQLPKNSKNEPAMLSHAHETLISLEEFIVSQSFWGVVGWFCSILSWSVLWIPNAFPMDLVSSPNPRCPGKNIEKHTHPQLNVRIFHREISATLLVAAHRLKTKNEGSNDSAGEW